MRPDSPLISSLIRVGAVMHRGVITCKPKLPVLAVARIMALVRALELMVEHGTTHAVVIDEQRAVGVVSVLDVAENAAGAAP